MSKNFSSIYNIKDYVSTTLAPKYFNMDQINDLNIGLLGMTTEFISGMCEDTFNTITTYLNEMHPNLAILSESVYNQAALFHDSNLFATPAELTAWLFIDERYILNSMEDLQSNTTDRSYRFHIDSALTVDIEDKQFMLDYDIIITIQEKGNEHIYSVQYETVRYGTEFSNDLSIIKSGTSPYIKTKKIYYNSDSFIALMVDLHQVSRTRIDETVINNTVLNASTFTIPITGEIAGFDVFCKLSSETEYTQLQKKMLGTPAVKNVPFCYYRLTDDNELEISFTLKDGYFKPDFGTELIIEYYTTLGDDGNFDLYTGSDIVVRGSSELYQYNNPMTVFCIPHSDSKYGADRMSVDDLKLENIRNFSTVKSYTTENDLQMYFSKFSGYNNVKTHTVKRRDDIEERIFSAFTRFLGTDGNIIRANTCKFDIHASVSKTGSTVTGITNAMDRFSTIVEGVRYIKPGQKFTYQGTSNTIVSMIPNTDRIYYVTVPATGLTAGSYWTLVGVTNYTYTLPDVEATDVVKLVHRIDGDNDTWVVSHEVNGVETEYPVTLGNTGTRLVYTVNTSFIYGSPFLIALTTLSIGYYLNTVNKKYTIDYRFVNTDSFDQFMCNSITIKRNAINGTPSSKSTYFINALITPAISYTDVANGSLNYITTPIGTFNSATGDIVQAEYNVSISEILTAGRYYVTINNTHYTFETDLNVSTTDFIRVNIGTMSVVYSSTAGGSTTIDELELTTTTTTTGMTLLSVTEGNLSNLVLQFVMNESVFILMTVTHYDIDTNIYTVSGQLTTTDVLSANNFQVSNTYDYNTVEGTNYESATVLNTHQIPMSNCPIIINARFRKYPDISDYDGLSSYQPVYTVTNTYTTRDDMTFIYPLNMVRSNIKFTKADVIEEEPTLDPSVSADDYNALRDLSIDSFPLLAESVIDDSDKYEELLGYFVDQYEYIDGIRSKITGNHTIDLKFYNTYGRSKNFIMESGEVIDSVNVGIKFKIKPDYGTDTDLLIRDIRLVIKEYIESINDNGGNSVYISNIIQLIENQFEAVRYIKFGGITGVQLYGLDNQTIENNAVDINMLDSESRRNYVPEYLNVMVDDIDITII